MKKISVFLLTLVAGLSLVACGSKTTKQATTKKTDPAPTPTPSYQTYTSKSYAEVMEAMDGKFALGVTLSAQASGATTYQTFTASLAVDEENGLILMGDPTGGMYFKPYAADEDYVCIYVYDTFVDAYVNLYVETVEDTEQYIVIDQALAIACGLTIKYTSTETTNFINRPCTKYIYNYKEGTADITEQYIIDNATGLCLKHAINSSATPGVETLTDTTFEVTSLLLGDDVDDAFDGAEATIEIVPWDSEFLNTNGFEKTVECSYDLNEILAAYTRTKPGIRLEEASYGYDGEGHYYQHETTIILDGTDQVNSDFLDYIVYNLVNCGAKYNDEGEVVDMTDESSVAEILSYTMDTSNPNIIKSARLTAYTDNAAIHYFELNFGTDYRGNVYIDITITNTALDPTIPSLI